MQDGQNKKDCKFTVIPSQKCLIFLHSVIQYWNSVINVHDLQKKNNNNIKNDIQFTVNSHGNVHSQSVKRIHYPDQWSINMPVFQESVRSHALKMKSSYYRHLNLG